MNGEACRQWLEVLSVLWRKRIGPAGNAGRVLAVIGHVFGPVADRHVRAELVRARHGKMPPETSCMFGRRPSCQREAWNRYEIRRSGTVQQLGRPEIRAYKDNDADCSELETTHASSGVDAKFVFRAVRVEL